MKIRDIVEVNEDFKSSINLYLHLNQPERIRSFIPTTSSVALLKEYAEDFLVGRNQATLLIGPYGKGKSQLLLILLSILSMNRSNPENCLVVKELFAKLEAVDESAAEKLRLLWSAKRMLPVLIDGAGDNLKQAFLFALDTALRRENIVDLIPDTHFSYALETIENWKIHYIDTYQNLVNLLKQNGMGIEEFKASLGCYEITSLDLFKSIYGQLTSGGIFSPMISASVLPLYRSVNEQLCENYGFGGIFVVFDEFSKFIESHKSEAAADEMKLLQDMCEFAANTSQDKFFITMVAHKSIKAYGQYLSREFINSFTGIEGRIKERFFLTSPKNNYELIQNAIIKKGDLSKVNVVQDKKLSARFYDVAGFRALFSYDDFHEIVEEGCYPLNPLGVYLLLAVSERVAQNERTLFTFLSQKEPCSMAGYIASGGEDRICASMIYDYFYDQFKKEVGEGDIHRQWLITEYALSKAMGEEELRLLKTMGLIAIVNRPDELVADVETLSLATEIEQATDVIDQLLQRGVIFLKASSNTFSLRSAGAVDLGNEMKKRMKLKGKINLNKSLLQVSELDYVLAKEYNAKNYMTRYFRYDFLDVKTFLTIKNSEKYYRNDEFCDGKVILLTNLEEDIVIDEKQILAHLQSLADCRIMVLMPRKSFSLLTELSKFEVLQGLRRDHGFMEENNALVGEMDLLEEELTMVLRQYIEESYFMKTKAVIFDGMECCIIEGVDTGRLVSELCSKIYPKSPIINNELINKQEVRTSPIKRARKTIIADILKGSSFEEYMHATMAEAAIYRAVFVNSTDEAEEKEKFDEVMGIINRFVSKCVERRVPFAQLVRILEAPPYGVRKGILSILIAGALKKRKDDVVIYFGKLEVPLDSNILINLAEKPEDYSLFISKESMEKEQYLTSLEARFIKKSFAETEGTRTEHVLAAMKRWFRGLPQVTRTSDHYGNRGSVTITDNMVRGFKNILRTLDENPYEDVFIRLPEVFDAKSLIEAYNSISYLADLMEGYLAFLEKESLAAFHRVFEDEAHDIRFILKEWYEGQSLGAKTGLGSSEMTELMTYLETFSDYDEIQIIRRIIRIITGTYIESWNESALQKFEEGLASVKAEAESFADDVSMQEQRRLVFTDETGKDVVRTFTASSENTANILKNIIEDALDDFYDLSANDKTAVLVQILEKVVK